MRYTLRLIALTIVLTVMLMVESDKNTFAQRIGTFGKENYSTVVVEDDSFRLDVYFNLVDGEGYVLPAADVERVNIRLQNNTDYTFEPTQPLTPFYITLVLDISGSMAGRANVAMREAVQQSLQSAPENAQFSIIAFHSEIITVQEFTGQTAVTQSALSTLEAVNGGGTCLYDAMWNALNKTKSVPTGRRAIIVFTDGVDEDRSGNPCSVVPLNDVILEAATSRIPLYTVGLVGQGDGGGRINTEELGLVADETGGLFLSGDQENLGSLFTSIMEALSSQWYIQAAMYPDEGEQIASVMPVLAGGQAIDEPFEVTFTSPRAFRQPVACTLQVTLLEFVNDIYSFNVSSSVPETITTVQLTVINKTTNTPLSSYPATINTPILVPLNQLQFNTAYVAQAVISSTDPSCPPTASVDFTTPPAPNDEVVFELGRISEVDNSFVQEFSITDPKNLAASLVFSVSDGTTNIRVEGVGGTMVSLSPPQLVISSDALEPQKKYIITADLLDSEGTKLATATGEFTTGAPPPAPVMEVVSIEPIERDQDVAVNLDWVNVGEAAEVTQISAVLIDKLNNTEVPNSQFRVDSQVDRIEFNPQNLKDKQSYDIVVRVNHVGGQETFTHTFTYNLPPVPLTERLMNLLLSPIVLAILILVAGLGAFVLWSQYRARKSLAYQVDPSLSRGLDARYTAPRSHKDIQPQSPKPSPRKVEVDMFETGGALPSYPPTPQMVSDYASTDVMPKAPPSMAHASPASFQTPVGNYVAVRVKRAKTAPQLIYLNNPQFDVMTQEIRFRDGSTIGREKEGPQKCDLILENDLNLSRQHLIVRPLPDDPGAYEVLVEGKNVTRFNGEIIPRGESFILKSQQNVNIAIFNKDGSEVLLEMSYETSNG